MSARQPKSAGLILDVGSVAASGPLDRTYWAESSNIVLTVEGLLLALGVLSLSFVGVDDSDRIAIQTGILCFGAWVAAFYFASLRGAHGYWVIACRTWMMVLYLCWIIWFTDALISPLRNALLLVILVSAITVGMRATLFVVFLVAANTVVLGDVVAGSHIWSLSYVGEIVTRMTPFIVVAYVTALYGHDLRYVMLRRKLQQETDQATGLLSMAGFSIAAGRLFGEARKESAPVSLLAITIDNFDTLADQHGREEVESAIREVSALVFAALRRRDVVGRPSPHTLLVLVAGASPEYCAAVEQRIRQGVSSAPESGKLAMTSLHLSYRSGSADAGEGRPEDLLHQVVTTADRIERRADSPGQDKATD
jgi:diguanylate cyclase (GGDEF)-like protein